MPSVPLKARPGDFTRTAGHCLIALRLVVAVGLAALRVRQRTHIPFGSGDYKASS
jgi:hypothetical protein